MATYRRRQGPRGKCPECKRSFALRADGTLRGHGWRGQPGVSYTTAWCSGSWKLPVKQDKDAS